MDQFEALGDVGIVIHFSPKGASTAVATDFVRSAQQAGYDVAWLLPIPTYDSSVPKALWDARSAGSASAPAPKGEDQIRQLLETLRADGTKIFDPWPVLCSDACRLADEQMRPFYFDDAHLTLTGAAQLEGLFAEMVESFSVRYVLPPS